jgi:type IV secretory pathway VirB3-like protein
MRRQRPDFLFGVPYGIAVVNFLTGFVMIFLLEAYWWIAVTAAIHLVAFLGFRINQRSEMAGHWREKHDRSAGHVDGRKGGT